MFDTNFCTDSNIESCFKLLVSELEVLNFPNVNYEGGSCKDSAYLLNVSWSLIRNHKRQVTRINEQNETILSLKSKLSNIEDTNKKNVSLLVNEQRQNLFLTDSLTALKSEKDKFLSEIKENKKFIKSLQGMLSKQQLQFEHDIRRKNTFIEDLQNRLSRLLGPESKKIIDGHSLRNPKDFSLTPGEKELMNKCLLSSQNNIQLLLMENVNLRNSLIKIYETFFKNKKSLDDNIILVNKERLLKLPYQDLLNEMERDIVSQLS